jgi:hypothetical protein
MYFTTANSVQAPFLRVVMPIDILAVLSGSKNGRRHADRYKQF